MAGIDPFGIGIKIQWTPGDINKQIQEIQSYIDTKKLNINFNVDKNALNGLNTQIASTSKSMQDLTLYTETMQNKLANLQIGKSSIFSQSGIQTEMKKFLDDLALVGTVGGKSTQELNLQFAQLGTSVRTAQNEITRLNGVADSVGTTFAKDTSKLFLWAAAAEAIYTPLRAFKQGVQDAIDLNNILTQTATAMNTTVGQLGAITTGAQQMSQAMGANITDVLQIMHVYANVNETADSIIKKTKADVILSNLTGMNGQETTNVLQGVQQQFKMTDDQLIHVDDALTKIAANLRVNYQTAIKEIGEGVKTAGTMAEQSGLSFEKFASIIGVTEERTRRSGSEIANAISGFVALVA